MIHVLHIRKTGGSALFEALHPYAAARHLVLHGHATRLADIDPEDAVVFAVRDPASRFCSGFNSRLRRGRPRNDIDWTAAEARAFARFQTPDALASALDAGDDDLRRAAADAVQAIPHLVPLSFWLGSLNDLERRADKLLILAQPNLDEDFRSLRQVLDIPDARLPSDDVRAHRTPSGFSTDLSAEARDNLKTLYREDEPLYAWCLNRRISTASRAGL